MLTAPDLQRSDAELSALLRRAAIQADEDDDGPDGLLELAPLFQLDDEVRNGGFAQYFFNPSCGGALDAWLGATGTCPDVADLLALALGRLGESYDTDLDIKAMAEAYGPAGLFPLLQALMDVRQRAHAAHPDPKDAFAAFRDATAGPLGETPGFDGLNQRFWSETNIDAAALAWARDEPELFVA